MNHTPVEESHFDLPTSCQHRQQPVSPSTQFESRRQIKTRQFSPTTSVVCTHALKSPDHVTAVAVFSPAELLALGCRRCAVPAGITLGSQPILISCMLAEEAALTTARVRRCRRRCRFQTSISPRKCPLPMALPSKNLHTNRAILCLTCHYFLISIQYHQKLGHTCTLYVRTAYLRRPSRSPVLH